MRLKEGQIWVHRDAFATVDKILRVVETHWFSMEVICQVRDQHGTEWAETFSFSEIVSDVHWQLANPCELFTALCKYYFKPKAVAEPKPEPYVDVWLQSGLPIAISNVSSWVLDENLLTVYDKNNTVIAKFNAEEVQGVVEKKG